MNLWLSRTQGALRVLLLVGICYSAADLTAARIERRLQLSIRTVTTVNTTTNVTVGNATAPGLVSMGDLQSVLNTTVPPLPSPTPARVGPVGPGMPAPAANATVANGPPPKLTGTMAGAGHSLAVLQAGADTHVVGIGEAVNGYTVTEVGQYSCTLRDPAGNSVTLTMDLANLNGGNSTAQAPPMPSPVVAVSPAGVATPAVAAKPGTLSSAELKDMLSHTEKYANAIQVRAMRKGDEVIGMQVNYSNPDNPFAKLGLSTGDVITSLNNHPLKGPEDLSWAYGELRNAQSLNFNIERNGQQVPLTIQLTEP